MKVKSIPYKQTKRFSKLVEDYQENPEKFDSFIHFEPSLEGIKSRISYLKQNDKCNRELLYSHLIRQYKELELFPIVRENIEKLKAKNTFTITTGHQLNIFGGPLYLAYKIASVINQCNQLAKQFPENNFVPFFWLASEDHDFEEISTVSLFGKSYKWENLESGAVGRMKTESIKPLVNELLEKFGDSENAQKLKVIIEKAYCAELNLSKATQVFINEIFGEFGLVILDADDKLLKSTFTSIVNKELEEKFVTKAANLKGEELVKSGYSQQVNARETNLFILNDIERVRFDLIENRNLADFEFSPNVLTRPIYQELLLPNIAYIGGGGELAYWLQLRSVFENVEMKLPVLFLRNSFMLVFGRTKNLMDKLPLNSESIFDTNKKIIEDYLKDNTDNTIDFTKEIKQTILLYDSLLKQALVIDKSLSSLIDKEKNNSIETIKKIEAKILKSLKDKESNSVYRVEKVLDSLFPNNGLQERSDSFLSVYLEFGSEFIEQLIQTANPTKKEFQILEF